MRLSSAASLLVCCGISLCAGSLAPLAIKDLSLMLRSGCSAEAVEREVAARHFIGPIDPEAENALLQAGASQTFVAALKSGAYAVPTADLAAVQQDLAIKAERRAAQAEESGRLDTLYGISSRGSAPVDQRPPPVRTSSRRS